MIFFLFLIISIGSSTFDKLMNEMDTDEDEQDDGFPISKTQERFANTRASRDAQSKGNAFLISHCCIYVKISF